MLFGPFRGHDNVGIDVVTAELANRVIGAVVRIAFAFTGFHVFFKIVGYLVGNRVPATRRYVSRAS